MTKNLINFFLFLVICLPLQAQITMKNPILNNLSLGFSFGLTQFHGDIFEKKNVEPVFSINLGIPIEDNKYSLQVECISGGLSAENVFSSSSENAGVMEEISIEGERFDMQFIELDVNLLISLSTLFNDIVYQRMGSRLKVNNRKFDFLLKLGAGLNMFRSLRQELETEKFINSYGYDWQWENNFENAGSKKNNSVNEGVFVLGLIGKYKLLEDWDIDFSATTRIGDTDKWDAKINSINDMFMLYSLGAAFTF
mgnify:CR=1 FL=1